MMTDETVTDETPGLAASPSEAPVLDDDELARVIEALLLVVDTPVSPEALASATAQPVANVAATLVRIAAELNNRDSGIDLRETGGGWRMYTRARFAGYVETYGVEPEQLTPTTAT